MDTRRIQGIDILVNASQHLTDRAMATTDREFIQSVTAVNHLFFELIAKKGA